MLKQFVKSVGDFERSLLSPLKREKCQWYFFFGKKWVFFEFVNGKYSEVGVGAVSKTCKNMENSCCVRVFNAKL